MTLATDRASSAAAPTTRPPRRGGGLRVVLRGLGEIFISSGLVVLLFVVYLLWWTDVQQRHAQKALVNRLEREWAAGESPGVNVPALPGDALAVLFIPRLGASYKEVVLKDAYDLSVLAKGPATYPTSAPFGGEGNLAIAGHRVTHGHPFKQLMDMKPGDEIVFETKDYWYTYKAVSMQQVDPTDVAVADDVPPAAPPGVFDHKAWPAVTFHAGQHLLTFSTCTPEYTATYRLILHGELVASDLRLPGFVPLAMRPGHGLAEDHDTGSGAV